MQSEGRNEGCSQIDANIALKHGQVILRQGVIDHNALGGESARLVR
jgi:hypothetical protein